MQAVENHQANEELMSAVINGDIDRAIQAIIDGASIHLTTPRGNSLLYVAASRHQEEMFDWLLEVEQAGKKIDLNVRNGSGATALFEMIREDGFYLYAKKLLQAGANPNIPQYDNVSPLIQACADKKLDEVNLLLDHNADVNYVMPDTKNTAFLMAASQSSLAICEVLKEKNADVNACDSFGKNALITALFKTDQFMKKKEKAEHKALCLFLTEIGIDLDYIAPSGMTAFWAASLSRDKEVAMSMLSKGVNADVWHEVGLDGRLSAMHLWCNSKEVDLVRAVHAAGGKLGVPDENGNIPEAYGFMNPALRELMLELNADVNAMYHMKKNHPEDKPARIPVISSIINGGNKQKEIVSKMIQLGAKVTFEEEDLQKAEPIFMAIAASAYDIVDMLLETKQIDVNRLIKTNDHGASMTAIQAVVSGATNKALSSTLDKKAQYQAIKEAKEKNDKNGIKSNLLDEDVLKQMEQELQQLEGFEQKLIEERKQIFNSLIKYGADVNKANENGHTAIFFCSSSDYAQWLKEQKADLFIKDNDGNNPLVYSVINNKKDLIEFLKKEYKENNHPTIDNIFYQLSFSSVDSHLQQSLLEKGIMNYLQDEIDLELLKKDKDAKFNVNGINYQDDDGNSPLLVACANNLPFLVSIYLKLGADINLKNHNDETSLMHAISTNNERMVEYLIDNKADVNAVTKEGKSVFDFAKEIDNKHILEKVKIALGHEILEGSISGTKKLKMS